MTTNFAATGTLVVKSGTNAMTERMRNVNQEDVNQEDMNQEDMNQESKATQKGGGMLQEPFNRMAKPEFEEVIGMSKNLCLTLVAVLALGFGSLAARDAAAGEEIRDLIETLSVGEPMYYQSLTIVPVYSSDIEVHSHYTMLDEALDRGWLKIEEVSGGRVPQVKLTNRCDRYIYIMGGEILTGCRQDRIVGRDVLIRPRGKNVIVPVYCVEQGRWSYETDEFYSKKNLGTSRLRAESQKAGGEAQGRIWAEIRGMCERVGLSSGTTRYQETYDSDRVRRKISDFEAKMGHVPRLYPDAVGVVVGVGGEIVSVDVFANPELFRRLWPKILKSAALGAVDCRPYGSITIDDAVTFLRVLHSKRYTKQPAIDLGHELARADGQVNVNALVYRDAVIHLAGFPEGDIRFETGDSERRIRVMRRQ
jgi:hypothetical protein